MNRTDLDPLLEEGVNVAQHFLEKNGEFFPFGVVLTENGAMNHVEGWTGSEQPPSAEIIELLLRGFRKGATDREYRATALVADVRLPERKSEAIRVTLEHRDGTAIHCFLPYTKSRAGVTYGEIFATRAEAQVFTTGHAQ